VSFAEERPQKHSDAVKIASYLEMDESGKFHAGDYADCAANDWRPSAMPRLARESGKETSRFHRKPRHSITLQRQRQA
jgi:hypothetical protein